jgi:hypothetical protein
LLVAVAALKIAGQVAGQVGLEQAQVLLLLAVLHTLLQLVPVELALLFQPMPEVIQHFHLLQVQVEVAVLLVVMVLVLAALEAVVMVKVFHLLLVALAIPRPLLQAKEIKVGMAAAHLVTLLVAVAVLVLLHQIVPRVKQMEGLAAVGLVPHCLVLVFTMLAAAAVQEILVMEAQVA